MSTDGCPHTSVEVHGPTTIARCLACGHQVDVTGGRLRTVLSERPLTPLADLLADHYWDLFDGCHCKTDGIANTDDWAAHVDLVLRDHLQEVRDRARADALAQAQLAVERDCADPSAGLAVMALQ